MSHFSRKTLVLYQTTSVLNHFHVEVDIQGPRCQQSETDVAFVSLYTLIFMMNGEAGLPLKVPSNSHRFTSFTEESSWLFTAEVLVIIPAIRVIYISLILITK